MIRSRGNILYVLGLYLVLLGWPGIDPDSDQFWDLTEQTSDNQTQNSSPGCFSAHNDVFEDEPMHQAVSGNLLAEPVIFIADHLNPGLIFQPSLIPWEPPRI